ncbi:MAG: hypothetical protein WCP77_16275 [Roseococcus sp.]
MTEYTDHAWTGSPAAMAAALTALGWAPEGTVPATQRPAHIAGIVMQVGTDVTGAPAWTALVRATVALPLPQGVQTAPQWVADALVGRIAELSPPRVLTKVTIYGRMTDMELETLNALLQQVTLRQRMSWNDATVIEVDRPDVQAMAVAAFGPERAAEILA